jgi:tetratricopeptide (TPR) repeat protein
MNKPIEELRGGAVREPSATGATVHPVVLALLLAAITLLVYWPVSSQDYIPYDDMDYVTANPPVLAGLSWQGIKWAFTTGHAYNWHPLTWLSLMVSVELFGSDASAQHIVNLLFHVANTVLLFWVLRRLTGTLWRSALVAAFFALHPLHVESVAWVSERKDVLSAFFFLLTLGAYAQYAQSSHHASTPSRSALHAPRSFFYLLALALFGLGLMSKPILVTVPFVLLLLDYWPLGRFQPGVGANGAVLLKRLIWEKVPFFLLSAAVCVVTVLVQSKAELSTEQLSTTARIENALVSYGRYLGKTLWPEQLSLFYPRPVHWSGGQVALGAMVLVSLCALAFWCGRKFPFLVTGWFWFVGMLIPVIGLVQVGSQSMADRYTYLPLIGLFIAVAWGVEAMLGRQRLAKGVASGAAVLALAACAVQTRHQLGFWENPEKLFRHALAVGGESLVPYVSLAHALWQGGQTNAATAIYKRMLEIDPRFVPGHMGLGFALAERGDFEGAAAHYQQVLQTDPNNLDVRLDLAHALAAAGRNAEAISQYQDVLKLDTNSLQAFFNLGCVLAHAGQFDDAITNFQRALQLSPDVAMIHNHLGRALAAKGLTSQAVEQLNEALRLDPNLDLAHANLGDLLVSQGNFEAADAHYRLALKSRPEDASLHRRMAETLAHEGKPADAKLEWTEALRLKPDDTNAQDQLRALDAGGNRQN